MAGRAWKRALEDARRLADDAAALVADRAAIARENAEGGGGGGSAARAGASARRKIASLEEALDGLVADIDAAGGSATDGEKDRRRGLVEELRARARQMKEMLKGTGGRAAGAGAAGAPPVNDRTALLGSQASNETESTSMLNNQQILQYQDTIMRDQDDMLDQLHRSVTSTKNIAIAVNEELDLHERLLDDLDSQVDQSQSNLKNASRKLGVLMKKTRGSWKSLCLIMLLIIGLVVVLLMALNVI